MTQNETGCARRDPKLYLVLLLNLLLLAPGLCSGAPQEGIKPPARLFTLQEAISYAMAHYPSVQAAIQRYESARAGVGLAATSYLPSANLLWQDNRATRNNVAGLLLPQSVIPNPSGTTLAESSRSFWGSGTGALFSYEPFDFGYRRAQVRAAESTEKRTQEQIVLTRLDVAAGVADASLFLLAAEQQVRASQADVDRRSVFAKSVHALVDAHLRPGADASRADAELAAARTQLALSQQAERVDETIFAQVMGLAGTRVEIKQGPFLGVPPQKAWTSTPISSHPAAAVEAGRVDEVQSRLDVLRHAYYPHLSLQALISERGTGANAAGAPIGGSAGLWPDTATNWAAGFTVSFPIFDIASNRARKRIELANRRQEEAVYDQTLQNLTGQVDRAQAVLEGARHVAENTPAELRASKDSETQAVARFRAGLGTLVDVAEAQRLLLQAEIDDSLATLNIWRALARLAVAQGNLQPFLDLANHAPVGGP